MVVSHINILNTRFNKLDEKSFFLYISNAIIKRIKTTVSFPNAYIGLHSQQNKEFNMLLNQFDFIVPDGIGVYLASKILFLKNGFEEIIVSTDIWFKLFNRKFGYKFYFIGGEKDCKSKIEQRFGVSGNFEIIGSIFKLSNSNEDINKINSSNADILMVALGTPYQEEWIIENKDKINIPVIIAVGSGLDFLAGAKKRAPLLMQKIGLEWLYRLFQEPKRLWKRYIFGIPVFMFNIVLLKVKLMFKKEST
jgi:exopolysaccharide biosynthesis WecB/TagA/CpsF family protein